MQKEHNDCQTEVWQQYQKGLDYVSALGLYERVERCHRMTKGDQWAGVMPGGERPAQLNILLPMMKQATALVGQSLMGIHFSSMDFGAQHAQQAALCAKLNEAAARTWEQLKMDQAQLEILEDAYIGGDSFCYFYFDEEQERLSLELLNPNNVLFGDEQNDQIQQQPYLIIAQRRYVADVRAEARANGLDEDEISRIVPDSDTTHSIGGDSEVENKLKLLSILKLWKEDGEVHICRSTKEVLYQPVQRIPGLRLYPIAQYSWNKQKGSARGLGDVWDKIPNQLSINKNLYRFECAVKTAAFPHKVYNAEALDERDVRALQDPSSAIAVHGAAGAPVGNLVAYLQPAQISGYAQSVWQDVIRLTRELSGVGETMGSIDPERASGTAILAARESNSLSMNSQVARFKHFVEDVARIWWNLWGLYYPAGMPVVLKGKKGEEFEERIPAKALREMRVSIRIDATNRNSYSKIAHEMGLRELFQAGAITLEEYINMMDDDGTLPKGKLQDLLERRKEQKESEAAGTISKLSRAMGALQEENRALLQKSAKLPEATALLQRLSARVGELEQGGGR